MQKQTVITKIVTHCSATKPSFNVTVDDIRKWHIDRGWSDIGYHYFIDRSGELFVGRDIKYVPAAHKPWNTNSLAICLAGGVNDNKEPENNFTDTQFDTWFKFINTVIDNNGIGSIPLSPSFSMDIDFVGHYDVPGVNKACPCFDVQSKYDELAENELNIPPTDSATLVWTNNEYYLYRGKPNA